MLFASRKKTKHSEKVNKQIIKQQQKTPLKQMAFF